jgi:hypothetical protein
MVGLLVNILPTGLNSSVHHALFTIRGVYAMYSHIIFGFVVAILFSFNAHSTQQAKTESIEIDADYSFPKRFFEVKVPTDLDKTMYVPVHVGFEAYDFNDPRIFPYHIEIPNVGQILFVMPSFINETSEAAWARRFEGGKNAGTTTIRWATKSNSQP